MDFSINPDTTTVELGAILEGTVHTLEYTITNTGNVPIAIEASAILDPVTCAGAVWNTTTSVIPVGEHRGFKLTLTIIETGSCTVTFDATEAT